MPVNNNNASRKYLVPHRITMLVRRKTIANTLEQIAHADLMSAHYKAMAQAEPDKQKREKHNLKVQQLVDGRELNYGFLEYVGYKDGDELGLTGFRALDAAIKALFG